MRKFVLGLAAAALLVAACSADASPVLRRPAPGTRSGGALRVGLTAPGSIEPGNVYEPSGDLIVRTMCTPLLATDPATAELLPAIAEFWLVTDGGAGLTLRLREGVRFNDGTPLTAEDVAFTLTRIASAEYASTSAELLAPIAGYPEIHGDVPTDDESARRRLAGVAVRDERTVQIALRTPQADFLRVLTSSVTAPVSQRAAQADPINFGRQPVCVGPYRLRDSFAPGDPALTLVRSGAYDPIDTSLTGGGRGYADSIEFRFYPDLTAAAAARDAGEVDVAPARPGDSQGVQAGPGPEIEYIGLPVTSPGFDEPAMRRALSLALDRDALIQAVFPGTRTAADGFLPATAPADDACPAVPPNGDFPAAQALVAQLGVDLRQIRPPIYFNDEFRHRALVEEVARQWRSTLGLEVVPTPLSPADFLARGDGRPGFDGPFRFSWSSPFSGVDPYLAPLFGTAGIGRDNFTRFSEPAVDDLILRQARRAQDPADRALAYGRLADLLCEAMPMIPVTQSLSRWLVADDVGSAAGSYVDGSTGQALIRELFLR